MLHALSAQPGRARTGQMSGPDHRPPALKGLDARLKKARGDQAPSAPQAATSGYAQGLRLSMEMVAAVAVGGGIGWFLDRWIETSPLFLLIFLVLGLAAGIRNVYQTANRLSAPNATKEEPNSETTTEQGNESRIGNQEK